MAVTILSAGFHEFGHAAAARSGGAQPGVMGAGVYLVWPAFYTDVTDSYRLGRVGRVRTDLGGLYFNAIVAVGIAAVWRLTGWDALLLVVATQVLQMVRQLTPLVRFDGYHVLADLTGVPDLYPRIWPTLSSLWPTRWKDPRARQLKPWARAVISFWVLAVVPMLAFTLITLVFTFPRIAGTAWVKVQLYWAGVTEALGSMDVVAAAAALVGVIACAFPVLAMGVMLWRLTRSVTRSVWRRTQGRPVRRATAGVLALALVAVLVWAWWPDPQRYRPVLPFEGGTLSQAVTAPLARAGVSVPTSSSVQGGYARTVLPTDQPLPTEDHPVPALVLVPHQDTGTTVSGAPGATIGDGLDGTGTGTGTDEGTDTGDGGVPGTDEPPTWVFPFDQPLPPDEGDNQAVAVNTSDGTVTYDVAVAMVWVTDDTVLNTNEAFAAASCSDCAAVAVAFQVVLIVGDADVIVPQNLATAANYDCFRCITAAIASQLVVTVDALPDDAQQVALQDLWQDIATFVTQIPTLSLADVQAHLEDYQQQILEILGVAVDQADTTTEQPASPSASATPSASGSASPTETSGASAVPDSGSAVPDSGTSSSTVDGGGGSASPSPPRVPAPRTHRRPRPARRRRARPARALRRARPAPRPASEAVEPSGAQRGDASERVQGPLHAVAEGEVAGRSQVEAVRLVGQGPRRRAHVGHVVARGHPSQEVVHPSDGVRAARGRRGADHDDVLTHQGVQRRDQAPADLRVGHVVLVEAALEHDHRRVGCDGTTDAVDVALATAGTGRVGEPGAGEAVDDDPAVEP